MTKPVSASGQAREQSAGNSSREGDSGQSILSLYARLPVVSYVWDISTGRLAFSEGLERITGFMAEPGADHSWWIKKIFQEDRFRMQPVLAKIYLERSTGQPDPQPTLYYAFDYRLRHANGGWVNVWDRAFIERDTQGKPLRAEGILEDITALSNMQKSLLHSFTALARSNIALRKQEEQVRTALADVPVAFFQTDRDLRYTWIYSPVLEELPEQYLGKRDDEIVDAESAAVLMSIKQTALDYWVRQSREVNISLQGKPRQVFVSAQPVFDDDQQPCGVVGAYVDITDQHSLENLASEKAFKLELNRRLLDQTEQLQMQIGRLIQDGPIQDLSGIGFALQLARQLYPDPESLKVLELLKDEVKNLVVELRQISNQLRPPGLTRFGLSHAVQSYAEEFQLRNPQIKTNMTLSDSGAEISDQTIQALFRIIEESFMNILHHAMASEIKVNLNIQAGSIRIEIKDNGCGFEGQPDWIRLTSQGHYGMLRMKESAEALGGRLEVKSVPQKGTVVVAEVPLVV